MGILTCMMSKRNVQIWCMCCHWSSMLLELLFLQPAESDETTCFICINTNCDFPSIVLVPFSIPHNTFSAAKNKMADVNWFYIKHLSTSKAIAACPCQDDVANGNDMPLMRSQVIVTKPTYSDNELWCWDGQQLRNKSTGLVLDIRKGECSFSGSVWRD